MLPISFLNTDGDASTIFITTLLLEPERSSSTCPPVRPGW
jgi:hypothetical protein